MDRQSQLIHAEFSAARKRMTHEDVQVACGEWNNYPAAFRLLDEVVDAEVRGRMTAGERLADIERDTDWRENQGR